MRKAITLLSLLGFVMAAHAEPVTFSWTNSTTNTNGSVFTPATDLDSTDVECTEQSTLFVARFTSMGDAESLAGDLEPGEWACRARHLHVNGQPSSWSNTVIKTVKDSTLRPMPPTLFDFNQAAPPPSGPGT